jgi:hypothetical protein
MTISSPDRLCSFAFSSEDCAHLKSIDVHYPHNMEHNVSIPCGPCGFENVGVCFCEVPLPSYLPSASRVWSSLKSADVHGLLAPISTLRTTPIAIISAILLASPFVFVYIRSWVSYVKQTSKQTPVRSPPIVPYVVPYLGSALRFGLDPSGCLTATR